MEKDTASYTGQIMIFAGDYAPVNWAICNGALLSINSNQALFSLIGTLYGGDGHSTFALPDLRGRVPIHRSGGHPIGEKLGRAMVALTESQIPAHKHELYATKTLGNDTGPAGHVLAQCNTVDPYSSNDPAPHFMAKQTVDPGGSSAPHENRQPYTSMLYIICLNGEYPPR